MTFVFAYISQKWWSKVVKNGQKQLFWGVTLCEKT